MKHVVLLFGLILTQIVGLQAQSKIYFHKDGTAHSWHLSELDSITYIKPTAEVTLPKSLTLPAGKSVKITYMVNTGVEEEPIVWKSSDSRIAYFKEEHICGNLEGKCVVSATYKGVTSCCLVTVTEAEEDINTIASSFEKMLTMSAWQTYSASEVGAYMSQALTTGTSTKTSSVPYRNGWYFTTSGVRNPWHEHVRYIVPAYERVCKSGVKSHQLVATTIYLNSLMLVADMYGMAPIESIYKSNSSPDYIYYQSYDPTYCDLATIYAFMDSTFNALLQHYEDSKWRSGGALSVDPYYSGDLDKWESLTKALYARFMLRKLPNWENTKSTCNKIISMVDDVLDDASWQEPLYSYPGGAMENNCPWGPNAPSWNSWETKSNTLNQSIPTTFFLHGILGGIDVAYQATRGYALDPRAAKMMEPSGNNQPMLHIESNIGVGINHVISDYPNLLPSTNPYTQNTGYVALITAEELMFIKAEAQYWVGDLAGSYATTVAATKKNMERYGLNEADIQSEILGTNLKNQYNRFFNIKLPSASQFTIADLMQQKYVAMYLQPEQWTDMRRYNYSSSTNGISYNNIYVYDVENVHNGRNAIFKNDSTNFCLSYSLRRPYNLYESYWWTADDFGTNAQLSPNAWVMQIPAEPTQYNKQEWEKMGYYTTNSSGEAVLDYQLLKKRPIWAQKHNGPATSVDSNITWK